METMGLSSSTTYLFDIETLHCLDGGFFFDTICAVYPGSIGIYLVWRYLDGAADLINDSSEPKGHPRNVLDDAWDHR